MKLNVKHCKDADKEHAESKRQYAHVYHRSGVICVARSFFSLPECNRLGLLLHEVGHVLRGPGEHTEEQANETVKQASGVTIYYRDGKAGKEVEWIKPEDKPAAREFLGL